MEDEQNSYHNHPFHPTHYHSHQGKKEVSRKRRLLLNRSSKCHGQEFIILSCFFPSALSQQFGLLCGCFRGRREILFRPRPDDQKTPSLPANDRSGQSASAGSISIISPDKSHCITESGAKRGRHQGTRIPSSTAG